MARILLVEDHERSRQIAKDTLERHGHQVIAETGTLTEALAIVKKLPTLGVELAILDGNLTQNENSGQDGQLIAQAIKRKCPNLKILVWSRQAYSWGDSYHAKGPDYEALVQAVGKLLES